MKNHFPTCLALLNNVIVKYYQQKTYIGYPIAEIKHSCLLDGTCLQTCIVLKAEVTTNKNSDIYHVVSDGEFKA